MFKKQNIASAPYKILYIHNSADYYGASRSLIRLIETLDKDVFIPLVVLPQKGSLSDRLQKMNVPIFIQPELTIISRYTQKPKDLIREIFNTPRSVFSLYRIIKKNQIDLVHTNVGVIPGGAAAAWIAGVPHVWHIREFFSEFKKVWWIYQKYILAMSQCVVAVSEATATQFSKNQKVKVIYNGFRSTDFSQDHSILRQKFHLQFPIEEMFTVGCVGRIKFQRKGQDVFIEAIALVKKRGIPIRGLIVGAPFSANQNQEKLLKELIERLHVEKEIFLTGEMEDVRPAYAAMDVFVLASAQPEPFGGVVMEAMGMALPIIATNIGGSPEQVEEGSTGFLIPPNDPQALADRIVKLYQSPEMRRQFGESGRQRLQTEFSLKEKTAVLEKIYLKILNFGSLTKK